MTTTKKKTKAPPPPPPPKNVRMDIVLDPQRQEIIAQLCEKTGEKANTKAVFKALNYYLHRKPGDEKQIHDLQQELSVVKNELYYVKQNINSFLHDFTELQKSVSGKEAPGASVNSFTDDTDPADKECPHCDAALNEDEISEGLCYSCDGKFDPDEL